MEMLVAIRRARGPALRCPGVPPVRGLCQSCVVPFQPTLTLVETQVEEAERGGRLVGTHFFVFSLSTPRVGDGLTDVRELQKHLLSARWPTPFAARPGVVPNHEWKRLYRWCVHVQPSLPFPPFDHWVLKPR